MKTTMTAILLVTLGSTAMANPNIDTRVAENKDTVDISARLFDKKEMLSPVSAEEESSTSVSDELSIPGWDIKILEMSNKKD